MSNSRWLIEMLIPSRAVEARYVAVDRTDEQLSAEIHASVAELLAYRPDPPSNDVTVMAQQQQQAQVQPRLLLAHAETPEKAMKIAADIRAMFGAASLPWSSKVRRAFDAYLQSVTD